MLARGYNIVSEDVALRKAKLDVDVDYNKNKVRGGTESYQVRELMSIYSLTLYGKVPIIYGSLINLRTGQIAKSIKIEAYSGSMSEFVEVLIDKMEGKPRRDARSDRRNLIIVGAFVGGTFLATLLLQIGK